MIGSVRDAEVYLVQNGTAVLTKVQLGTTVAQLVEVLGGIKAGDMVVTAGQNNLENGIAVSIIK